MKFRDELITNILNNEGGKIGELFREIEPSKNKEICLAQGYGLSRNVPVRLLAYPVPVMRLAKQLGNPEINLYIAKHGVERANQSSFQLSCSLVKRILENYVKDFYQIELEVLVDRNTTEVIDKTIKSLLEYAIPIYEKDCRIRAFVDKRGGVSSLQYMVEHILYMRDPIDISITEESLLIERMSFSHEHIIMIGGPAEKIFYQLRQQMLEKVGFHKKWKSHQLFTPIGNPPTYHQYEDEPVFGYDLPKNVDELFHFLNSLPNDQGKAKNVIRDYKILLQEFAGVEKFILPHKVKWIVFEKGYERLKHFVSKL